MKEDKFWRDVSNEIIYNVEEAVSPLVGKKEAGKIVKMGADGTPTKMIDVAAEEKVIEILKDVERPVTLVSEEIGEFKIGEGSSEVFFVVDPLDGTSNALKKIPAYGISIAVADARNHLEDSLTIQDIEVGLVKNMATGDLYEAVKGEGSWMNGEELIPSVQDDISSSSIGAFIYGTKVQRINNLCKMIRRMRILGSVAIELCYVASGAYDAFMDLRGNLRIVDIAAAKLIVEEAGGVVTDQSGGPLNGKLNVRERTAIVAVGNQNLHKEIMKFMGAL